MRGCRSIERATFKATKVNMQPGERKLSPALACRGDSLRPARAHLISEPIEPLPKSPGQNRSKSAVARCEVPANRAYRWVAATNAGHGPSAEFSTLAVSSALSAIPRVSPRHLHGAPMGGSGVEAT